MKKLLVVGAIMLFLAGCGGGTIPPANVTVVNPSPIEIPPLPDKADVVDVQWKAMKAEDLVDTLVKLGALTVDQANAAKAKIKQSPNQDYVIFALDPDQLKNWAHNADALRLYILQAQISLKAFINETAQTRSQGNTSH